MHPDARSRLGRRCEDRFGQARAFQQAGGQRDARYGPLLGVLSEAQADEVSPRDAFDADHAQSPAPYGSALPLGWYIDTRDDVVRYHVLELVEPPERESGQDLALVGDLGG